MPVLNIPGKHISISNSSDILRYLYATTYAVDPERAKFLEPSPEAVKWEAKIDQMGDDIRAFVYYHVSILSIKIFFESIFIIIFRLSLPLKIRTSAP